MFTDGLLKQDIHFFIKLLRSIHGQRNALISQNLKRKAAAGIPAWQPFLYIGVFYKLREKERSKESAYVLVAFCFLARPLVRLFVFQQHWCGVTAVFIVRG